MLPYRNETRPVSTAPGDGILTRVAGMVYGHHLGELDQRALGGAVDAATSRADPAYLRGDVNNATATGTGHVWDYSTAHEISTGQIYGDGAWLRRDERNEHCLCS